MAIEFTESAGKHGFDMLDALHAIEHAIYSKRPFETSRIPGGIAPDLWIGPTRGGVMLEVMNYLRPPRTLVIFHVMPVRPKFAALIPEGGKR